MTLWLAKICYAVERHVRAVKRVVDVLISKGLLEEQYEDAYVRYAISRKGIDFIEAHQTSHKRIFTHTRQDKID